MIVGFPLGPRLRDCPQAWQNFMEDLQTRRRQLAQDVPRVVLDPRLALDRELKKYGAKLHQGQDHEPSDFVEFVDRQHLMMFYLQWS